LVELFRIKRPLQKGSDSGLKERIHSKPVKKYLECLSGKIR